ncbi:MULTISPECIES: glycerol-3-phosphate dehydrogenase subunit GlpB [Providencia]|uniref:Anaerobic glycerol-3-phosphate dehydrogenase subunit B n=1 Tax=Providencia huaxiensis TaxID=2027290 RepID=A0ABU2J2C6_9GAMM|nr:MULTISPECIES: glycerol-3-phosphate dehydrogenase subunit GlpB [Providencia]MBZ3679844.1 glycerol-3-phosphate dehydrogenase subunit GlpB [Providencia rettgeri]AXH64026.1 glycerol-3-phosphate dehydrogenase subunit GlpB [Providencia huaxiensis]MDT0135070.1 glycerol-3-phosphate dehydrogenase subunit GlpB [Providencia huaxiensis]MDT1981475.1 glycerol-3-phosphate dehydrogenase subunit GlpB [Providencia huaxiensis]QLR00730.1 glycerol-3-phosphate dehydrogenase subunit GlpB [Providencia rettgeri]
MKYDVVVMGGGLAGLMSGIRLTQSGLSCAIVSAGQNALHFSSGSLDLLTHLPNGEVAEKPLEMLDALKEQSPAHPYSLIGKTQVTELAHMAQSILQQAGVHLKGFCEENHYRITPLGHKRMTWLSPKFVPTVGLHHKMDANNIAVVGIEGFLDFQPQMVADELQREGLQATAHYVHLPLLDRLRENPSEFRAVNVARWLDRPENMAQMVAEISPLVADAEAIFMPACIGLDSDEPLQELQRNLGKPIFLLPTLPPSLLGIRLHEMLLRQFRRQGGIVMPGDKVTAVNCVDGRIESVQTRNHGDISLKAKHFVLATGSFFNNGLVAEFDRVYEPLMQLDLCEISERAKWTNKEFFASQPYMAFGVKTDEKLRAQKEGNAISNLYVAGAVLGGFDPLTQGCGAGVSIISALYAANEIINELIKSKTMQVEVAQ